MFETHLTLAARPELDQACPGATRGRRLPGGVAPLRRSTVPCPGRRGPLGPCCHAPHPTRLRASPSALSGLRAPDHDPGVFICTPAATLALPSLVGVALARVVLLFTQARSASPPTTCPSNDRACSRHSTHQARQDGAGL